jgi:hypothetical protein
VPAVPDPLLDQELRNAARELCERARPWREWIACAGGMARVGAFGRRAAALDYPMQAAHYRAGWREVTGQDLPMAFIIAETEPPHLVIVGFLPHWAEEVGRARMDAALADFARRESEDDWPTSDYPETFVEFDVPPYYERTIP